MADDVDAVMQSIPAEWRTRWCGGELGPCACMGCVQIGNRAIMAGLKNDQVDAEYINEARIPPETYKKYKVTKEEWERWMEKQK
jgi:pyridoxine/pyridoxamine 5'-phosphate oxidase